MIKKIASVIFLFSLLFSLHTIFAKAAACEATATCDGHTIRCDWMAGSLCSAGRCYVECGGLREDLPCPDGHQCSTTTNSW
jgi:hypothetical protein